MRKSVVHPVYGEIVYEENVWSGKKNITINATPLRQIKKNTYRLPWGATEVPVVVKGSFLTGVDLQVQQERITVIQKTTWYDWLLSMLPFALMIVWGNNVQLCSIIPVVGGAIGGALGGIGIIITRLLSSEKSILHKVLIALLVTAATFAVGVVLGFAIVFALL